MIIISKHNNGGNFIVKHSLILLEGTVSKQLVEYIKVDNQTTGASINWPVVERRFKILVYLKPGANTISIRHSFYQKNLHYTLLYNPKESDYIVQPLYILSKDNITFQSPPGVDNSPNAAIKRIGLGLALLQLFTAETLQSLALGSATFQLPLDNDSGIPRCSLFHSKYSSKELYAMTDRELWRNVARELMESHDLPNRYASKFVAFLACTRYDGKGYESSWKHQDVISATKGHVALGGGGLALLGSGTLHTWADNLHNLVKCFTDETRIDRSKFMDDSANRLTFWANYATGLGATLHELGHTFDLPHTQTGIMSRGFDNIHMFFVVGGAKPVSQQLDGESAKLQALKKKLCQGDVSRQKRYVGCDNSLNTFTLSVVKEISVEMRSSGSFSPSTAATLEPVKQPKSFQPATCLPSSSLTFAIPSLDELAVTESASCWSLESATLLRYSKWLMQDVGNPRDKGHVTKPVLTSHGQLYTPHGLKVLQVFRKCLDQTAHSQLLDNQEQTTSVDVSEVKQKVSGKHKDNCSRQTCDVLHLRDGLGNFYSLDL